MTIYEQINYASTASGPTIRERQNGGGWYTNNNALSIGESYQVTQYIANLSNNEWNNFNTGSGSGWGGWHNQPTWYRKVDTSIPAPPEPQELRVLFYPNDNVHQEQELKVHFYPDNNVEQYQKLDVFYYPDGNTQDVPVDKQLDVWFYPNQNVTDMTTDQEVKVFFYPDGNVSDVETPVTSDGFKWWFGMKGKKKYGNNKIKRIKL